MTITEVLIQPQAMAWLPWAVQYFFYIGSAYAAAILFFIALLFEQHTSHRLRAALVLTLVIGAIVGPLALTGDLHQPGRAWHFYAHFTPWSWMSLGSLLLPLFSGLAVLTAWLYLRNDLMKLKQQPGKVLQLLSRLSLGSWQIHRKGMMAVAALTVLSGLTIAVYTGAEIAVLKSRPLWHQPAAPMIWFVTAFLGAVGFTLWVWLLIPSKKETLTSGDARLLKKTTALSGVLALVLLPIWASNNTAFSLYETPVWVNHLSLLTALLLGSAILSAFTLRRPRAASIYWMFMAAVTLATAWAVRWITMMEVQTIPKFDAGLYPYELPTDSNGLIGIIGMFGLWLALALACSELVHSKREPSPSSPLTKH